MGDHPNCIGQQLGNYRLPRLLGKGGFAEVYLGEHVHLGTQAAVKVLYTQLTNEDVDAFLRTEARTIAHLIHPYIVRVLDFGVEDKTPFLVMDYAPYGTLRNLHPKGSFLPVATIITYVKQIAEALQYAHDQKLIHRDIKPENMLAGERHEVLLSDFSLPDRKSVLGKVVIVKKSKKVKSGEKRRGCVHDRPQKKASREEEDHEPVRSSIGTTFTNKSRNSFHNCTAMNNSVLF